MKKCIYYIDGMHCPSCEILIEKTLKKQFKVEGVKASLTYNKVEFSYVEEHPSIDDMNKAFHGLGYKFSTNKVKHSVDTKGNLISAAVIVSILALIFLLLGKTDISSRITVDASSSLTAFFIFGLVASVSSCAALVGGILLSLTKKWNELYITESAEKKAVPFVLFNLGRILSFALLGGVLGLVGSVLKFSLEFSSVLVLVVSLFMALMGLQMLGVKWANKVQIKMPKSLTGYAVSEDNFAGRFMPLIMGILTFFVPCGFTIIAQGIALTSGDFVKGSLVMLSFALGTLPMLSVISFSSIKLNSKPALTAKFNYAAGMLILFFGLYSFNAQLNVLGLKSLSDINLSGVAEALKNTTQAVMPTLADSPNDLQIMQIEASGYSYYPRNFTIKSGVRTRLEIMNSGAVGCANAVTGRGLFNGVVSLKRGVNTVEFTPAAPGTYKITCTMGMVPPVSVTVI